ncbi:MAG: T9SS type A sorting domain-containing protein [Cytophagaceae bacterium]
MFQPAKAALVTIPDANFRAFLKQQYPGCFSGDLMETTCSGVVNATTINCSGLGISNLTGISYFTNLKELTCAGNALPNLPNLPLFLTDLHCSQNLITSLPSLPASLIFLDCENNKITSLPVLPSSLETLACRYNQLTSLPSLPTAIKGISCENNQLTNLPTIPLSLEVLNCSYNLLTSLPTLPSTLKILICDGIRFTVLPSLPSSLERFYCNKSQLTSLPVLPTSLEDLSCRDNALTSLPTLPPNLRSLTCNNNALTTLPTLPESLSYLICYNNPISYLSNIPSGLRYLDVGPNQIKCIQQNRPGNLIINSTIDGINYTPITIPDCPPITITNSPAPTYCIGSVQSVTFTAPNIFQVNNIFTAYLTQPSNPNFTPINVGSLASTSSGTISITIPPTIQTSSDYSFVVRATNGSESIPTSTFAIINPSTPLTITGSSTACPQQTNISYSLPTIPAATYVWNVPTGASLVSGQGTSSIKVNWGVSSGDVSVRMNSSCGTGINNIRSVSVLPAPRNVLSLTTPNKVYAGSINNVFSVSNSFAGTTYNWMVPSGCVINSGQGTSSIVVTWGNVPGNIQVREQTTCGTGTYNSIAVNLSDDYAFASVEPVCGNLFALPLIAKTTLSNKGVIGIDYTVNYNPALFTPSTSGRAGQVVTPYGSVSVNTAISGKVIVSVYLSNAPVDTYFSGTGEVARIWFTPVSTVTAGTAYTFSMSSIEESTAINTFSVGKGADLIGTVKAGVPARITYRSTTLNLSSVSNQLPVQVKSLTSTCVITNDFEVSPDGNGVFSYIGSYGPNIKIARDIKGGFTTPASSCTSVQNVINSADIVMAVDISTQKITAPTIYQLLSADVNQDGKVTAGDVSLISSRSVNNYCEFPQSNYTWNGTALVPSSTYQPSKDWVFVTDALLASSAYTTNISRNNVPLVPECLPAPTGTASCSTAAVTTYRAILLGDVNGSWNPASINTMRQINTQSLLIDLSAATKLNNGNWMLPVKPAEEQEVQGVDMTLEEVPGTDIIAIHKNPSQINYQLEYNLIEQKKLMLTAYSENYFEKNVPVFYLEVGGNVTPTMFHNTAAYVQGEEVEISYQATSLSSSNNVVVDVYPNPTDSKDINIYVEDNKEIVLINVIHANGSVIKQMNVPTFQNNKLSMDISPGIYFLSVESSKGVQMKKLVIY